MVTAGVQATSSSCSYMLLFSHMPAEVWYDITNVDIASDLHAGCAEDIAHLMLGPVARKRGKRFLPLHMAESKAD